MTRSNNGVTFQFCNQYHSSSARSSVKRVRFENTYTNSMKISVSRSILEKDVYRLVMSVGQKKFLVPMRNRTADLRIPRSDALPLRHRDSTVSEVYCEVHMTRVLHTARISNDDSVMFSILELTRTDCAEKEKWCLQLKAAKKSFAHEIEAICAI